jgi:hypothetical protein
MSEEIVSRSLKVRYWWAYLAFASPFLVALFSSQGKVSVALRSGLLGISIAYGLYVLWKIYRRLGKPFYLDRRTDNFVLIVGCALWLIWFGIGQVIFMAKDEVTLVWKWENPARRPKLEF